MQIVCELLRQISALPNSATSTNMLTSNSMVKKYTYILAGIKAKTYGSDRTSQYFFVLSWFFLLKMQLMFL